MSTFFVLLLGFLAAAFLIKVGFRVYFTEKRRHLLKLMMDGSGKKAQRYGLER